MDRKDDPKNFWEENTNCHLWTGTFNNTQRIYKEITSKFRKKMISNLRSEYPANMSN